MSTRPPPGRRLPSLPDSDQDFSPDLVRKIIEKYQEMLLTIEAETREACAVYLAQQYPDNANTNAFCAAIRSMPASGADT